MSFYYLQISPTQSNDQWWDAQSKSAIFNIDVVIYVIE